jgi:hypothetical protein
MSTTRTNGGPEQQVLGMELVQRVGAAEAPVGGVRGMFVPHMWLRTQESIQSMVKLAVDAKLRLVYPCVLRYGRELFKGKFPRYTYVPDGAKAALDDEYATLLDQVKTANQSLPADAQIKVIPWVEMFLNARTPKDEDRLAGGKYESLPKLTEVLDVDHPGTRELLVQQLVDLAEYDPSGEGIHVDDHLSYPPDSVPEDLRPKYEAKMTRFATWLIAELKRRAPGKVFEISTNKLDYAIKGTQANWAAWGADRVIIQLYLPSAQSILGSGKTSAIYRATHAHDGANLIGIGVTCTANGAQVPDEDIIKVMKFEARDGKVCVVWHAGDLARRPSLIQKVAALSSSGARAAGA